MRMILNQSSLLTINALENLQAKTTLEFFLSEDLKDTITRQDTQNTLFQVLIQILMLLME